MGEEKNTHNPSPPLSGRGFSGARRRTVLVPYDRLSCIHRDDKTSHWQGERGTYVFESSGVVEARKPIQRVYLNRKYFTGLFTSRREGEYSGDIKDLDGKHYLVFKVVSRDMVDIFERVAASASAA